MVNFLKIDKAKLNTLLRSGLNPNIKTRKKLASYLNLDPTSLTRWFATRDRLGNPRYPVVPDRHVTKILKLFDLSAEALSLDEEEFRQHCFDLSLKNTKHQDELANKSAARLEQAKQRSLAVTNYPSKKRNKFPLFIGVFIIFVALVLLIINMYNKTQTPAELPNKPIATNKIECWKGFSTSLGDYQQEDTADPCHYAKLLHKALTDLEVQNESKQPVKPNTSFAATQNYILFLSEQLDQRRLTDKIKLNVELGKNEFRSENYPAAQQYFQEAQKVLRSSNTPDMQLNEEISHYLSKINIALN